MEYKMFIDDKILTYGESLSYASGTEVASLSFESGNGKVWVSIQVCGSVRLNYKGTIYKDVSQFPSELLQAIKDKCCGALVASGELDIIESNWWEICYSNGDGCVLDMNPNEFKSEAQVAETLVRHLMYLVDKDKD